jgi:proteasome lid subunit RPN8/RPN11
MLRLAEDVYQRMIGHCYDGLPLEACGLLAGHPGQPNSSADDAKATVFYPCRNEAQSSKLYRIGIDYMKAERDADDRGIEVLGVVHSHTHTDPYPSPTDIENAAAAPTLHYVIVSLRDTAPMVRSYRISDGTVMEESLVVEGR